MVWIYGFRQKVPGGYVSGPMDLITPETRRWVYDGGSVTEVTGTSDTGYIVEGTQLEDQIRITNETIDLGPQLPEVTHTDENTGFLGTNTEPTEQQYLANHATPNAGYSSNFPIFQHYPEGGTLPSSPPQKDPLEAFLNAFSLS